MLRSGDVSLMGVNAHSEVQCLMDAHVDLAQALPCRETLFRFRVPYVQGRSASLSHRRAHSNWYVSIARAAIRCIGPSLPD
jgi:hypothetical protein